MTSVRWICISVCMMSLNKMRTIILLSELFFAAIQTRTLPDSILHSNKQLFASKYKLYLPISSTDKNLANLVKIGVCEVLVLPLKTFCPLFVCYFRKSLI